MNLTKNFNKSEFDCNCGCEMPEDVLFEIQKLAAQLQTIRDFIRKPVKLTNAYRCPKHNKAVGGVSNSQHILGKASDLVVKNLSTDKVYTALDRLMDGKFISQGGLGKYNTFTHYDIRGHEARW